MSGATLAHPEIIVALGGGLLPDGSPAPMTVARAAAAAALAGERREAAVICSGSHGHGPRPPRSEAAIMAELLVAAGIDRGRVFVEDQSRDTLSNAALVAGRYLSGIAPRPLIIVTSPFHMRRSLATFALVLGPSWPLEAHASARGPEDSSFIPNEERYLANTRSRLAGVEPGDLPRILERVRATQSQYISDAPRA